MKTIKVSVEISDADVVMSVTRQIIETPDVEMELGHMIGCVLVGIQDAIDLRLVASELVKFA